jgi:hypothetical protein
MTNTGEQKISEYDFIGGVMLYLPEDAPAPKQSKSVLDKILGDDASKEKLEILGPADKEDES